VAYFASFDVVLTLPGFKGEVLSVSTLETCFTNAGSKRSRSLFEGHLPLFGNGSVSCCQWYEANIQHSHFEVLEDARRRYQVVVIGYVVIAGAHLASGEMVGLLVNPEDQVT
jgi:hypothetical protein